MLMVNDQHQPNQVVRNSSGGIFSMTVFEAGNLSVSKPPAKEA
jgi:hypothetical protein